MILLPQWTKWGGVPLKNTNFIFSESPYSTYMMYFRGTWTQWFLEIPYTPYSFSVRIRVRITLGLGLGLGSQVGLGLGLGIRIRVRYVCSRGVTGIFFWGDRVIFPDFFPGVKCFFLVENFRFARTNFSRFEQKSGKLKKTNKQTNKQKKNSVRTTV